MRKRTFASMIFPFLPVLFPLCVLSQEQALLITQRETLPVLEGLSGQELQLQLLPAITQQVTFLRLELLQESSELVAPVLISSAKAWHKGEMISVPLPHTERSSRFRLRMFAVNENGENSLFLGERHLLIHPFQHLAVLHEITKKWRLIVTEQHESNSASAQALIEFFTEQQVPVQRGGICDAQSIEILVRGDLGKISGGGRCPRIVLYEGAKYLGLSLVTFEKGERPQVISRGNFLAELSTSLSSRRQLMGLFELLMQLINGGDRNEFVSAWS